MKSEKYYIKIKFHRNPRSDNDYIYEFIMALFENGNTEEFLLFIINKKNIDA